MSIYEVRRRMKDYWEAFGEDVKDMGICQLVEVENMGYCRDGISRWYHFDVDGIACYWVRREAF